MAQSCSSLAKRRPTLRQRRTTLRQRRTTLRQRRTTLRQRRTTLRQRRTTLRQRRTTLRQRRTTLRQRRTTLRHFFPTIGVFFPFFACLRSGFAASICLERQGRPETKRLHRRGVLRFARASVFFQYSDAQPVNKRGRCRFFLHDARMGRDAVYLPDVAANNGVVANGNAA